MGNDVTLRPSSSVAIPSPPAWLEPLIQTAASARWGELQGAPKRAIDAAAALLPQVRDGWPPATLDERAIILTLLADQCVVTPDHPFRSNDEARIARFFDAYHQDLGHVPRVVLADVCAAYRRAPTKDGRPKWYPSTAELLKLAHEHENWRRHRIMVRGLIHLSRAPVEAEVSEQPEEWRARMQAWLSRR